MRLPSLFLVLLVGACASSSGQPLSPAAQVFAAKTAYQAPLQIAVTYNNLPRCGVPKTATLCSDQAVVVQLRKANDAALASLDAAEGIARTPGISSSAITLSLATADHAVKAFTAIATIYGK